MLDFPVSPVMSLYKLYSLCNDTIYLRTIIQPLSSYLTVDCTKGLPPEKFMPTTSPPSYVVFFNQGFWIYKAGTTLCSIMITNWFCMLSKATIILPIVISLDCPRSGPGSNPATFCGPWTWVWTWT